MDEINEKILIAIGESRKMGEEIWVKKLVSRLDGRAAEPTVHKRVRGLVKEGMLTDKTVTEDGIIYKYLYLSELGEQAINKAIVNE